MTQDSIETANSKPEWQEAEGQILENIVFEKIEQPGGKVKYINNDPEKKRPIIVLSAYSEKPRPGIPYKVKIVEVKSQRKNKEHPGKFIVELILEENDKAKEILARADGLKEKLLKQESKYGQKGNNTRMEDITAGHEELRKIYEELERLYNGEIELSQDQEFELSPEMEIPDTEMPETTEQGHDAEKFLNDFFDWIEKNTRATKRENWGYTVLTGGIISMCITIDDKMRRFVDRESLPGEMSEIYSDSGVGFDGLIKFLKNKKIICIDHDSGLYLKIVG